MVSLLSIAGLAPSPSPSPSLAGDAPPEGFVPFDQQLYGDSIWVVVIKAVLLLIFLLVSVILAVWFERKVISRMQERVGPNVHGPFGLFQLIGDTIKLVVKEDVSVSKANKVLYIAAPMVSVVCAMLVFSVIPIGPAVRIPFTDDVTPIQLTDFTVAGLFVLACSAIGVYGIVLGGWASGSTYPLLGAVRSTAQVISYELAMGLSFVTVFILSSSMYTQDIVSAQEDLWFGVALLPAFLLYIVAMVGETNRLPFDLPEAEGELVAGYMTEYSSVKFAWYFLAEYINMLNVSAIATTFFLGGWRAPWPLSAVSDGVLNTGYWPILWFLAKLWLLMFVFVWIRGSLMRLRYDQFMRLGWKVLIPVGLGWMALWGTARLLATNDWLPQWVPDFRAAARIAAVVMIIAIIVILLWPRKPEEDRGGRKRKPTEIDAHAGGFPVPPRPGEKLPPSPRSGRTVEAHPRKRGSGRRG